MKLQFNKAKSLTLLTDSEISFVHGGGCGYRLERGARNCIGGLADLAGWLYRHIYCCCCCKAVEDKFNDIDAQPVVEPSKTNTELVDPTELRKRTPLKRIIIN